MSWKHRITTLLLAVFTALPVSETLCAIACDPLATTGGSSHHGSGKTCEEPAPPATGTHVRGLSAHNCSDHDAAVRETTTTAPGRADVTAASAPFGITALYASATQLTDSRSIVDYNDPLNTAPPSTTPLVLRV